MIEIPPHIIGFDGTSVLASELRAKAIRLHEAAEAERCGISIVRFARDDAGWWAIVFDADGNERAGASGQSLLDVIEPVYRWLTEDEVQTGRDLRSDILNACGVPR